MLTNAVERAIARQLCSYPRIKIFLQKIYIRINYVIAKTKSLFKPAQCLKLSVEAVTAKDATCFFGYYDRCPWDHTQRYLLYLQAPFDNRMPNPGEAATLGVIDLQDSNKPHELGQTIAWNWQQGCMQQWLINDSESLVIHNDFRNGHYVSIIRDLNGNVKRTLPLPVYIVSEDSTQALSLNFARLYHGSQGYGYVAKEYKSIDQIHPEDDGIWHMDLQTGEHRLIISLDQIVQYDPKEDFQRSFHYFNHLSFNPSGTRIIFLHRWFGKLKNGVPAKGHTRMFTANPDGTDICCLADHRIISHFIWKDDSHILAWLCNDLSGKHYYFFEDKTANVDVVGDGLLNEDGHPSYSPDGRWFITDTYPDRERVRTLILFDVVNSKRIDIGRFHAPFKFDALTRCDLHPRWSPDGKEVCFDSAHEGRRRIYTLDVSSIV